jgi:mannosylglycoprotein endo-beta-mannosidase
MPTDKAPGPDGFTGCFFKACWETIKNDVTTAFNAIYNHRCNHLNLLNSANIVLVPKKDGAEQVSDFRPISLIHGFAKIFSKLLALRLQPLMHKLVSTSLSAFIRGRSIHDNFLYVRSMVRKYHRTRRPMLLFKLDISKAFDSVRWDYLLTLLQHRGFPQRFCDWVSALFATSSSKILLNGIPGTKIIHGRGLRQGDPLSPLVFILAIDPLQRLLSKATELKLLSKLRGKSVTLRTSLYADDAAVFIKPGKSKVQNFTAILHRFGLATGLRANIEKTQVVAIRCENVDLDEVFQNTPATRASLPMKYLGLPLTTGKLRKADLQPLFDKSAGKMAVWRGRNLGLAGRTTLVKSVLSSQPVYLLTALKVSKESMETLASKERASSRQDRKS